MRPLIVELDRRAEVGLGALRPGVGHQQRELVRVETMAQAENLKGILTDNITSLRHVICAKCSQVSQEYYLAVTTTTRKGISMFFFSPESEDPLAAAFPTRIPSSNSRLESKQQVAYCAFLTICSPACSLVTSGAPGAVRPPVHELDGWISIL